MGFFDFLSLSPCKGSGYKPVGQIEGKGNYTANGFEVNVENSEGSASIFKKHGENNDFCVEALKSDITVPNGGSLLLNGDSNKVWGYGDSKLTLGDARYNELYSCQPKSEINGWNSTNRLKCE